MKVTKNNRKWVCAFCGSEKLIEKVLVSLNHEVVVDGELYVKYIEQADEYYWCDDCHEEATPVSYEDYHEKTDK